VQLAAGVTAIAGNQAIDDVAGTAAFPKQFYAVDAIVGIDQRLGRDRAMPAAM